MSDALANSSIVWLSSASVCTGGYTFNAKPPVTAPVNTTRECNTTCRDTAKRSRTVNGRLDSWRHRGGLGLTCTDSNEKTQHAMHGSQQQQLLCKCWHNVWQTSPETLHGTCETRQRQAVCAVMNHVACLRAWHVDKIRLGVLGM
jgi:hypothetical protein